MGGTARVCVLNTEPKYRLQLVSAQPKKHLLPERKPSNHNQNSTVTTVTTSDLYKTRLTYDLISESLFSLLSSCIMFIHICIASYALIGWLCVMPERYWSEKQSQNLDIWGVLVMAGKNTVVQNLHLHVCIWQMILSNATCIEGKHLISSCITWELNPWPSVWTL